MISKRTNQRVRADFLTAAALLNDDNLVWSADLDSIRHDLAKFLEAKAGLGAGNNPHLIAVVESFIDVENDLSIGE